MDWLAIAIQLEPAIPGIISDLRAIFTKHPALGDPAAQAAFVAALGKAAATADDQALALIAADQAAHGATK